MSSQNKENTKQIKNIKEQPNNKITDQEQEQQKQQIEDKQKSTISDTTTSNNKTESNNINEYQHPNKAILDNSIETTNKYQLQTINSIQSFSDNSISIQQNIFTTFQSGYSKFITNIFKSYWNNFLFPTPYLKLYNNTNQIIIDNTINTSRMLNDLLESHIEPFNISVELAQKYYNNGIRNYFNFSKKIIEMIYNH
jgi:hypothetical protein